jgi:SAM-dependent methyltransferase
MSELAGWNPTGRFSGLAEIYSKSRPSYPREAIDQAVARCDLTPGSLLVDVGCGTGISSRLFAERGMRVIGIEPNADMRAAASAHRSAAGVSGPTYQDGRAEATGLPNGFADAVLAAQAFHWFEAEPALAEFHRILKPGGWVVLLWNERDERDLFTAAYGAIIRTAPDALAVECPRGQAGAALLAGPQFRDAEKLVFPNEQRLDEEGLVGRAFSASYAPQSPQGIAQWKNDINTLFSRFQHQGKVSLRYETSLYLARRRDEWRAGVR